MTHNWVIFRKALKISRWEIFRGENFRKISKNFRNYVVYYVSFSKIAKMAIFEIGFSFAEAKKF